MGEWIMRKDRVPETGDDVLCVIKTHDRRLSCVVGCCYHTEYGDFWVTQNGINTVVAWMPLPALPEV